MTRFSKHYEERQLWVPDDGRGGEQITYPGKRIQVLLTVAVETPEVGDWASYRVPLMNGSRIWPWNWDGVEPKDGPVSLAHALNECMKRGDKLSMDEAEALFPTMAKRLEYRS